MLLLIYILCGIIVTQQIIYHFERKDLYNRIMSKNFTEYKGESAKYHMSAHKRVLDRWKKRNTE